MKLFTSLITLTIVSISSFAQAALIRKACYQAESKKFGAYVVEVAIYTDEVIVNYKSKTHGSLGGYRGRILSSQDLKNSNNKVSVKNLTLNDGLDGFLDNVEIEITRATIKFISKNSVSREAKPQISCQ
jgi:hypothetical protein